MSNARELGLLEKWTSSTSDGATIIPPLSSPTSPKATKFCCCPNRRRYNLKQPKLTTTLHVRNIFVDNDFNFIDDTTTENDDDEEEEPDDDEILTLDSKNYKRAESWPSAKRTQKYNKSTKLSDVEIEVHQEKPRKNQVAATNDYGDIIEIANSNSNNNRNSSEKRVKVEVNEALATKIQTAEKEWRHDKSCHNNRNNCLTKNEQHERKSNNNNNATTTTSSRCSIESSSIAHKDNNNVSEEQLPQRRKAQQQQQQQHHHTAELKESCVRKPPLPPKQSGNEVGESAVVTDSSLKAIECRKKLCENFQNTLTANEQTATKTSPLIQRLSEISEFKHSLCKEIFSNTTKTTTAATTPATPQQHCNNCQFCFNQSCRNFAQLQQSLRDTGNSNSGRSHSTNDRSQQSSTFGHNQKMTITTATNVANNFESSIASTTANNPNSTNGSIATSCGLSVTATMSSSTSSAATTTPPTPPTRTIQPPSTLLLATSHNNTPTSPIPRSNNNTPSPLTTTVIKTTMVKRSPANESATTTTTTTSPTSATSASLTLEKSLAFIAVSNNVHDMLGAIDNKPANNKCLMDAAASSSSPPLPSASSTPLSVKERIAALVAGNEQIQKQHDNFINRNSMKNQCNKPLRSATSQQQQQQQQQNMTSPQRQQQHEQSIVINGHNTSNMCQKSPTTTTANASKVPFGGDEIDGTSTTVETNPPRYEAPHIIDNINHKTSTAAAAITSSSSCNGVQLRTSKPGSSAATIPRCSLSNHLQYHNAVNKYGSKAPQTATPIPTTATSSSSSSSPSASTTTPAMTVDKQQHHHQQHQHQRLQQHSILSNAISWPTAAASTSSSNDTTGDNSHDLTAPITSALPTNPLALSCRNKLAALDNLDLALNLSDLPLDVDDDDDPYFVLQEYLERVKHEINEVFELHKARQKLQQQQQPPFESDTNTAGTIENQIIDTLKAAVSNDELSRSTESDSGFDSATGGGWCGSAGQATVLANNTTSTATNGGSYKLPSRAKVTTTSNEKEKQNDNKQDNDTRVMEIATKNEQQQQQAATRTTTTSANSKEAKPPKGALIPAREQGKQEQEAASLPYSSSSSTAIATATSTSPTTATTASSSTLKRLRKQLQTKSPAEVATDDVNMWANKFLRDLDNLMASDKATTTSSSAAAVAAAGAGARASISPGPTSPMLLSAAATAVIQSRYGKGAHERYVVGNANNNTNNNTNNTTTTIIPAAYDHQANGGTGVGAPASTSSSTNGIVLRPEKHATIPLQSFNLDCGRLDNNSVGALAATGSGGNVTKTNVAYLRTLSAPTPSPSHTIYQALLHNHDNGNSSGKATTCGIASSSNRQLPQRNSLAGGIFSAAFDQHQNSNLTNFQSNEAAAAAALNGSTADCSMADMSNGDIKSTMSSAAQPTPTTILKIEETSLAAKASATATAATSATIGAATNAELLAPTTDVEFLHQKRLRQLNMEMDNLRNTSIDQSQQLSALMQQNHYCSGGTVVGAGHSPGNKHKTLMTNSSCAMPKKASSATATAATSTLGSPSILTCTMAGSKQQSQPTTTNTAAAATSYLLHGSDATKKGSTSTIWTSEESILRSVGAVDEDNNSTSSSACEEASGVLSSGKSGISLDSSGVENDNNESGIGTATPPKDMSYWRGMPHHRHHHHHQHHHHHHHHHHNQQDNESVSSLDALRKMKFQKGSSVTSSDDPDLLEVLSLCDETHGDDDDDDDPENGVSHNKSSLNEEDMDDYDLVDEEDEGHDEFETIPFCDCDCTEDGDASSASAGSSGTRTNSSTNNGSLSDSTGGVVLRRKNAASPIMVPQKCRSQSLDTTSLPNSYQPPPHMQGHTHAQLARKLQHLRDRHKDRNQLSLALRQEPFQSMLAPTHFHELPSPSSASLHSGHEILDTQELSTKSNSAPLLLKQEKRRDDFANQNVTLRYSRSQSDRYLAEIEAVEACKWLRAAGFPQYAQMYEDHQFPLDLTNVAKDHTNLENDQLQSLYRRLCILNRCAHMRVDQSHKAQTPQKEDSDDENFALSENWTFQPHIRRWSRIGEMGLEIPPATKLTTSEKTESSSKESSPDRFEDDAYDTAGAPLSLALPGSYADESTDPALNDSTDVNASPLRRTGSERLKDGAKAILRRVESIKSRRRKRQGMVMSGPQALDLSQLGQRSSMRKPDAVYSTPPSPSAVSPMHSFNKAPIFGNDLKVPSQSDNFLSPNRSSPKRTPTTPRSMRTSPLHFFTNTMPYLKEGKSDDSSSYYSDSQESSSAVTKLSIRKTPLKTRRFLQRTGKVDDIGAHSDSECHQGRKLLIKDANANTTEVKAKKLSRGGSLNLGRDGKKREGFRSTSFRSRSTTRKEPKPEETEIVKKAPVVRWHSFQLEERPNIIFHKCLPQKNDPHSNEHGILFAAMSAGQLQMVRKLALVTLTGYMERYCPTHRSGWNWELPKFIKKIKMPDYKDKKVFGVPLLLILQRSGQTLPVAVRAAFRWLQLNALDQIGLFRKSGVKSRILKLKELIEYSESSAECMDVFDTQQAYDVADMLKQYFRDLPESLLTTKMSETFAAIFQHLPPEVRLDAIQSAVLLLPDENREILYALLEFLTLVAANSPYNQMTANNLAVCLAPSLFHNSISTGSSSVTASPRRKGKGSGVPDAKELFEAKASHECLAFMIEHYKQIYTAPKEKLGKCKFGYMEESKPLPLEALGEGMQFHNWRGYLYESTSATIKEGREKSRGWITITSQADANVEIAYKKVGDGHPLRLWRCITEIEGPPKDVLDYIIRQRASWDPNLLQSQTIKKFDDCTEIFQFAIDGQQCTDFCVLRSWRTDLPRGACVIVETSIDHAKAKSMFNAVRGVVLASRYLIEPCGSGRSRVMHLARVDVKGRTPEWYNKSYGHISSHFLTRIRLAFKNVAEGPESKV